MAAKRREREAATVPHSPKVPLEAGGEEALSPSGWLTERQAADYLGLSLRKLSDLRDRGVGPRWLGYPGERPLYWRDDLRAFFLVHMHSGHEGAFLHSDPIKSQPGDEYALRDYVSMILRRQQPLVQLFLDHRPVKDSGGDPLDKSEGGD